MTNKTGAMSASSIDRLREDCHAAVCGLQELRHHLAGQRLLRWPAKDWDASNEYVSANIGHASKVAEWDLPKVEAAIQALSEYWEILEDAAPAEDVRAAGEEPVAWRCGGITWSYRADAVSHAERFSLAVEPLYRRPQRPVVLPERIQTEGLKYGWQIRDAKQWNACIDEFERLNK